MIAWMYKFPENRQYCLVTHSEGVHDVTAGVNELVMQVPDKCLSSQTRTGSPRQRRCPHHSPGAAAILVT